MESVLAHHLALVGVFGHVFKTKNKLTIFDDDDAIPLGSIPTGLLYYITTWFVVVLQNTKYYRWSVFIANLVGIAYVVVLSSAKVKWFEYGYYSCLASCLILYKPYIITLYRRYESL